MSDIVVRDFKLEDEQAVLKLYEATPELHPNAVVDFSDDDERAFYFAKNNKLFLVAVDDLGDLKGFIYVNIKPRTKEEEKARILHLGVCEDHRKSGVATQLEKEASQRLEKQGIVIFYANVNAKNVPMASFLTKNGFEFKGDFLRFEKRIGSESSKDFPLDLYKDFGYFDETMY